MNTLRIGTRGSALALWQAHHVAALLQQANPNLQISLDIIRTSGDKIIDVALAEVGGKGLFVKEIEDALLVGRVDLAVHSLKDVPASLPDGLAMVAFLPREDPSDALVLPEGQQGSLATLPQGARIGSSSLRRRVMLHAMRPDLDVQLLRGNVDTRLRKLDEGDFDAIVLASAGLTRLGLSERISQRFTPEEMLPAIGQGILGLESRASDARVAALVASLHHPQSALAARAERGVNTMLQGSCQHPIAAHALQFGEELWLRAFVANTDGSVKIADMLREKVTNEDEAEKLGLRLAKRMLESGADALLRE